MEKEYLTGREVAKKFDVSLKWVYKHSFKIKGRVKAGHTVRYKASEIDKAANSGNLLID